MLCFYSAVAFFVEYRYVVLKMSPQPPLTTWRTLPCTVVYVCCCLYAMYLKTVWKKKTCLKWLKWCNKSGGQRGTDTGSAGDMSNMRSASTMCITCFSWCPLLCVFLAVSRISRWSNDIFPVLYNARLLPPVVLRVNICTVRILVSAHWCRLEVTMWHFHCPLQTTKWNIDQRRPFNDLSRN